MQFDKALLEYLREAAQSAGPTHATVHTTL